MRAVVLALALGLLTAALPDPAHAQFLRYTDEHGQNHYVDSPDKIPERYRNAVIPLDLRNVPAPPPGAEPAASAKPPGTATIKYTPGQRIMVDVKINGGFTTKLVLDTGADRTLISPRALTAAGVALTRPIATGNITGVTDTDRINYVLVESLEVDGVRVGRMPVGSYELAGEGAGDGLLGRDFLDQFKITMDARAGEVHLTPK